jgi:hypothetical protein
MSHFEQVPDPFDPRPLLRSSVAPFVWDRLLERVFVLLNVLAFVSGLLITVDVEFVMRPACAALLFLFGAGSGLTMLMGRIDVGLRYVLAVSLSVAVSILLSEVLLAMGALRSTPAAVVLTVLTGLGVLVALSSRERP